MGLIATVDWGAVGAIGGLLLAILMAMLRLVVLASRLAQRVEDHTDAINKNAQHLDGLMAAYGPILWRVQTMEDFLEDEQHYRPPRQFPQPQS